MGVAAPVVLGFVYLFLLKYLAGLMVWLTILLFLGGLAGITILFFFKAGALNAEMLGQYGQYVPSELDPTADYARYLLIAGWVMVAIDAIFLLVLLVMISRIRIAIGVVKEASASMRSMPLIIFFPFWIYLMLVVLYAYWLVIFAWILTAGDYTTNGVEYDRKTRGAILYHFFGLLWTNWFILAIGDCTVAGAAATWYFSRDKKRVPGFPVLRSFGRVWRYHLGSLAFGSFIIALIKFVRAILAYLQRKAALAKNVVLVWVFGCMQYCLSCFERFIKFLNRRAYIMIAIYGYSFCTAAKRGAELLLKNILRVAAVSVVGDFLIFIGKLAITAGSVALAMIWLTRDSMYITGDRQISSTILPCIVVALMSYSMSCAFMSVYDMTIDTILMCFCEDAERNDGSIAKPYFASENLLGFLNNSAEQRKRAKGKGNKVAAVDEIGPHSP